MEGSAEAVEKQLENQPAYVGRWLPPERDRIIFIFDPQFRAWGQLQAELPTSASIPTELRPACFTNEQRKRAEELLQKLKQEEKQPLSSWRLEPSFGGYRVNIPVKHPEAIQLLEEQFGPIVSVWPHEDVGLLSR